MAWFRAWKFYRRLILVLWVSWLVLVLAIGFVPPAAFLLSGMFPGKYVWMALALLLPPALAGLICKVLSAPAFAGVPEVGWTRRRLFLQALWGQIGIAAVGVCLAHGFDAGEVEIPSLNFLGALGLALVCLLGWFVVRNAGFVILPPGEPRQRLFELAEQIQVRVHQVHLMPAVPWRLVNALGTLGNCVYLTGEVLPHLSRREVDALLALELVRLWQPRGRFPWRTLVLLVLAVLAVAVCVVCGVMLHNAGMEPPWPLFVLPGLILVFRGSRRTRHFVPARDRDALAITGDPEALITALAKLHRLKLLPLVAGQERNVFAGPVADWPRLQDLADHAGIPPEQLHEILDRPGSGEDRYPHELAAAGATPEPEDRVFTKVFKRRAFARQNTLRIAVEITIPALIAYLVQSRGWHGIWLAGAYLAGLLLLFVIRRRLERFMSGRTAAALRRGLRDKLASEGFEMDTLGGTLVGLAPHGQAQLRGVFDLGRGLPAIVRRAPVLSWRPHALRPGPLVHPRHLPGSGHAGLAAGQTRLSRLAGRGTRHRRHHQPGRPEFAPVVAARVEHGRPGEAPAPGSPAGRRGRAAAATAPLPGPDFGTVTSESLAKLGSFGSLVGGWVIHLPFAIVACFLLGLSFDPEAGAGAWYVLLVVALRQVAYVLPFRRYRVQQDDTSDADALAVPASVDPETALANMPGSRPLRQAAKAADCKSAIPGSNPGGASPRNPSQSTPFALKPLKVAARFGLPIRWSRRIAGRRTTGPAARPAGRICDIGSPPLSGLHPWTPGGGL